MSFWGGLLNGIANVGASFIPGGSLAKQAIQTGLGAAGAVVGGMGNAATKNRAETGATNLQHDLAQLQANNAFENAQIGRGNLELNQQTGDRAAANDAYRNALRSALAMHMKDVSIDIPGVRKAVLTGGARPSALGEEGVNAASIMNNQALQHLMNPQTHTPLEPLQHTQIREAPKAGFWEKLSGPLGMGLTAAGNIGRIVGDDDEGGVKATATDISPAQYAAMVTQPKPLVGLDPEIFKNVRF